MVTGEPIKIEQNLLSVVVYACRGILCEELLSVRLELALRLHPIYVDRCSISVVIRVLLTLLEILHGNRYVLKALVITGKGSSRQLPGVGRQDYSFILARDFCFV